MVEECISTDELRELQKEVHKKNKRIFRIPISIFVVLTLFSFVKYYFISVYLQQSFFSSIINVLPTIMIAILISSVVCIFYIKFCYQKVYDRFNFNFKNRYIIQTLYRIPSFKSLQYSAQEGFTYDEVKELNIVPIGRKGMFQSSDSLTGILGKTHFRCCNMVTAKEPPPYTRQSLPQQLFYGQIIEFSGINKQNIPQEYLQIFSKKALVSMKTQVARHKIKTNNDSFNENFCVYAENENTYFYILTPKMIEKITAISKILKENLYIVFLENSVFIAYEQLKNPFDAYIDIPIEEQEKEIINGANIIQKIYEILINDNFS